MILYLVDISSFIFRAFYAIRPLHTPSGARKRGFVSPRAGPLSR